MRWVLRSVILCCLSLLFSFISKATIFYSNNATAGADANTLSNWDDNPFGPGTSPANFNGADFFLVGTGHSYITTATWNLPSGGAGSIGGTLTVAHSSTWDFCSLYALGGAGFLTQNNGVTLTIDVSYYNEATMTHNGGDATTSLILSNGATVGGTLGTVNIGGTVFFSTTNSSPVNQGVIFVSPVRHTSANSTYTNNGVTLFNKFNESSAVANSHIVNSATGELYIQSSASTDFAPTTLTATASGNRVHYYTIGDQPVYATTYDTVIMTRGGTKTASGDIVVNSMLKIESTSIFDVGTNTLSGAGGLTMAATACELRIAKSGATAQPELTGTYSLGAGSTITLNQSGATNQIAGAHTYANLKLDGGNASSTFDLSGITAVSGDLIITGSSNMNSSGSLDITGTFIYSSTIASTLTGTLIAGAFDMTSGGGTLNAGSQKIEITSGNWTRSSGTFNHTSFVKFSGGNPQSITGTMATQEFYDLIVEKTGGTLLNTGGSVTTITVNNDFTQNSGNFTAPATMNFLGNAILSSGTYTASTNTNFSGNVTFGNTYTTGTFATFTGSASQAITKTGTASFFRLTINKSANHVTLNNPISVNATLTLTQGKIITTSTNILTLERDAEPSIGDSDSYIDGPVKKITKRTQSSPRTFHFPIGKGNDHRPCSMYLETNDGGDPDYEFIVEVFNSSADALGYTEPVSIDKVSNVRYWEIDGSDLVGDAALTDADITLYFGPDDGVTDSINLVVVSDSETGTTWDNYEITGTATGTTLGGSITSPRWVSDGHPAKFGKFTLGNAVAGSNPLPIELLSFNATYESDKKAVNLEWITASEINNDYFIIQRSEDGINYDEVIRVDGAGNSNVLKSYQVFDENPLQGTSYYRLKQIDFDGNFSYSNIVPVFVDTYHAMDVFPNPAEGRNFNIQLSQKSIENDIAITIYSVDGQKVFSENLYIKNSLIDMSEKAPNLLPGVYFLEVATGNNRFKERLVIY